MCFVTFSESIVDMLIQVNCSYNYSSTSSSAVTRMEELAQLQASRKGYKSHVTWLYNKVNEILSSELNEFSITSLTTAIEQLNKKKETLSQIDRRVTELIESPEDLKEAIFDAEETQDTIVDKIAKIRTFIELQTRRQSSSTTVSTNEAHLNVNSQ